MNFSDIEIKKVLCFKHRLYLGDERYINTIIDGVNNLTDEETICVYELYHSNIDSELDLDEIAYNILLKRIRRIKLYRIYNSITLS